MDRRDKEALVGRSGLFILLIFVMSLFAISSYQNSVTIHTNGVIASINRTWQGGDLQNFENETVSWNGHTFTYVFSCNYYPVGSSVSIVYVPKTTWTSESIGISWYNLAAGC